jgi:hypothetical protein
MPLELPNRVPEVPEPAINSRDALEDSGTSGTQNLIPISQNHHWGIYSKKIIERRDTSIIGKVTTEFSF